jgi:hypothetical protein
MKSNLSTVIRYFCFAYTGILTLLLCFTPQLHLIQTESLALLSLSVCIPFLFYFIEYQHQSTDTTKQLICKFRKFLAGGFVVLLIFYFSGNQAFSALNVSTSSLSTASSSTQEGHIQKALKGDYYDFIPIEKNRHEIKVRCNLIHGLTCPYTIQNKEIITVSLTSQSAQYTDQPQLILSFKSNHSIYSKQQHLADYTQQKWLAWFYVLAIFIPSLIIFYLLNKILFSNFKKNIFQLYAKKYNVS